MIFDAMWRLEADPHQRDPARGWAAELADPPGCSAGNGRWASTKAEDASSPVAVTITTSRLPSTRSPPSRTSIRRRCPPRRSSSPSPATGGPPAGGSGSVGGWPPKPVPCRRSVTLAGLPVPYQAFDGSGPDGRVLWLDARRPRPRRHAFGSERPPGEPADLWDPASSATPPSCPPPATMLRLDRHDGGDLDWFSADATGPIATSAGHDHDHDDAGPAALPERAAAPVVADRGRRGLDRRPATGSGVARHARADRPDRQPLRRLVHVRPPSPPAPSPRSTTSPSSTRSATPGR